MALLFREFCPRNTDIVHILLKVSALNDFYSTNIFDTHAVARHIAHAQVDERISEGDPSLVNELANVTIGGKTRSFYSFASKYCNHHNPNAFPIYDSYVEKMLCYFQAKDSFGKFRKADLRDYRHFVSAIHGFRLHYGLDKFSLREIDIYLWLAGKDSFRRSA